jgi:hypothetical protein
MGDANSKGRLWISEELQVQRDTSVSVVETVSRREKVYRECPKMREMKQIVSIGGRRKEAGGDWRIGHIQAVGSWGWGVKSGSFAPLRQAQGRPHSRVEAARHPSLVRAGGWRALPRQNESKGGGVPFAKSAQGKKPPLEVSGFPSCGLAGIVGQRRARPRALTQMPRSLRRRLRQGCPWPGRP